jgi:hypothetical protein
VGRGASSAGGGGAPWVGDRPPRVIAAEVRWKGPRALHAGGRARAGVRRRANGESSTLGIFAEGRSGDDEPDSQASRMQRLIVFFTPFHYICQSNLFYGGSWSCSHDLKKMIPNNLLIPRRHPTEMGTNFMSEINFKSESNSSELYVQM